VVSVGFAIELIEVVPVGVLIVSVVEYPRVGMGVEMCDEVAIEFVVESSSVVVVG